MMTRFSFVFSLVALFAAFSGCTTVPQDAIRVGTYNIRLSSGDRGTPNAWESRRGDLVDLVRKMDLDVSFYEKCGGPRIDYIYVSSGVRVLDYVTVDDARPGQKRYPSDHFPITATLVLP